MAFKLMRIKVETWAPENLNAWATIGIAFLTILIAASAVDGIYHRWSNRRRKLGIDLIEPCFTNVMRFSYDKKPEDPEYDQVELLTFVYFRLRIKNISSQDDSILTVDACLDGAPLNKSFTGYGKLDRFLIYNGDQIQKFRGELFFPHSSYDWIDSKISGIFSGSDASLYQFSKTRLGVSDSVKRELTLPFPGPPLRVMGHHKLRITVTDVHRSYVVKKRISYNPAPPIPF